MEMDLEGNDRTTVGPEDALRSLIVISRSDEGILTQQFRTSRMRAGPK